MATLAISLGLNGTTVRLSADEEYTDDMRRLALAIPSSKATGAGELEVDIDGFLRQIQALAQWPSDDVVWTDDAKRLAQDAIRDERTAEAILSHPHQQRPAELDLTDEWRARLTEFQQRDALKLLALTHGANFSVPGAGKTRVALSAYGVRRQAGAVERLLVVAPKSAFDSWHTENNAVWPGSPLRMANYQGIITPGAEALLVNYERLAPAQAELAHWLRTRPSMLILDEAHRMKLGANGTYGSACLALGPLARHRLILTGTPAPNGPDDLRNLFGFVWPGRGRQVVSNAIGLGNLQQASSALQPFFTRTTKRELDLPPVVTSLRRLDLPPLHAEIYRSLAGQMSQRALGHADDLEAIGRILVYLMMAADTPALLATGSSRYEPLKFRVPPLEAPEGAGLLELMEDLPSYELSPKYKEVLAIVAENASRGRKTLVWSTFIRSLTSLEKMLESFNPAMVHGGTEDRAEQIGRFRRDSDCMVLLSNPATLGEGISLHHECHDAVFVDRDFAAGRYLQSLDRIHRLGLEADTETRVTVLLANGTIDEIIDARLTRKLQFMSQILDDPDIEVLGDLSEEAPTSGGLDLADIQALMGHLDAMA